MISDKDLQLEKKTARLGEILRGNPSSLIALSGGVDSTYLVRMASIHSVKATAAVTVKSKFTAREEYLAAVRAAEDAGVALYQIEADPLEDESVASNPPDRCYFCKRKIFESIKMLAAEKNFKTVMDGTNADDILEERPGLRALNELDVMSPLLEAGLMKSEIRHLSKEAGIAGWSRPSNSCLATRIPHGQRIEPFQLEMIEAAEIIVKKIGIDIVRVRWERDTARIEIQPEMISLLLNEANRGMIVSGLKSLGFKRVSVDLEGYVKRVPFIGGAEK